MSWSFQDNQEETFEIYQGQEQEFELLAGKSENVKAQLTFSP